MRVRISITLPEELRKVIDRRAKQQRMTRSNFIEIAVQTFIARLARDEQNARDLDIINRRAGSLNREVCNVLEYQTLP